MSKPLAGDHPSTITRWKSYHPSVWSPLLPFCTSILNGNQASPLCTVPAPLLPSQCLSPPPPNQSLDRFHSPVSIRSDLFGWLPPLCQTDLPWYILSLPPTSHKCASNSAQVNTYYTTTTAGGGKKRQRCYQTPLPSGQHSGIYKRTKEKTRQTDRTLIAERA